MDFLAALDMLLALSLIYLVFALAVTSFNESIAAALSSRARWLRRGIASLLSADPKKLDETAADKVLDSPFVTFLGTPGWFKTFRPSYIPAWTLMQGVLSTVEGHKADAFAKVADIRALADKLPPESPMRSVLIDLCARAGDDLDSFRKLLDEWFATFETQLTAWYRQKTQYVLIGLSLAVAVAMNVDTLDIVRQFSADPKVLRAVVEQARSAAQDESLATYLDTSARDTARKTLEEAVKATRNLDACSAAADTCKEARKKAIEAEQQARDALAEAQHALDQRIADKADALMAGGLKLGWQPGQFRRWLDSLDQAEGWNKLLGLLISACALALGAPFWFNVLKSVASVRSVGNRQQDKPGTAAAPGT